MKVVVRFNDGRNGEYPSIQSAMIDLLEAHKSGKATDGAGNKVDAQTKDTQYILVNRVAAYVWENDNDHKTRDPAKLGDQAIAKIEVVK